MAEFIENRAIPCNMCGYGPIFGREEKTKTRDGMILECRWFCPRCGALVRIDEAKVDEKTD